MCRDAGPDTAPRAPESNRRARIHRALSRKPSKRTCSNMLQRYTSTRVNTLHTLHYRRDQDEIMCTSRQVPRAHAVLARARILATAHYTSLVRRSPLTRLHAPRAARLAARTRRASREPAYRSRCRTCPTPHGTCDMPCCHRYAVYTCARTRSVGDRFSMSSDLTACPYVIMHGLRLLPVSRRHPLCAGCIAAASHRRAIAVGAFVHLPSRRLPVACCALSPSAGAPPARRRDARPSPQSNVQ